MCAASDGCLMRSCCNGQGTHRLAVCCTLADSPFTKQCMLGDHRTALTHTSVSVQAEVQEESPLLAGKVPSQQTSTAQDVAGRVVQPGHPETPQGAEGQPQVRRPG